MKRFKCLFSNVYSFANRLVNKIGKPNGEPVKSDDMLGDLSMAEADS